MFFKQKKTNLKVFQVFLQGWQKKTGILEKPGIWAILKKKTGILNNCYMFSSKISVWHKKSTV